VHEVEAAQATGPQIFRERLRNARDMIAMRR
jgi:hypothetical protein